MHIDACVGTQCMHCASVGYHVPRAYIPLNTTLLSVRGECVYGKQVCTSCSVKWCSIKRSTEDSIEKHTDNMDFFFTSLYPPTSRRAHTSTHWNQFRLDMHFIPGSWCTLLLRCTCRRCLNLLPSFPPLGRNNSQRHGRNTGRLRRKPPRQTHTQNYSKCLSKLPLIPPSVFKHLKLLILQKGLISLVVKYYEKLLKYKPNKTVHPLPVHYPCLSFMVMNGEATFPLHCALQWLDYKSSTSFSLFS